MPKEVTERSTWKRERENNEIIPLFPAEFLSAALLSSTPRTAGTFVLPAGLQMGFSAGLGDGWGCLTTMEVMLQGSAQLLSHSHNIYLLINTVSTTTALQKTRIPLGRKPHGALAQLMAVHSLPFHLRQVTGAGDARSMFWLHIPPQISTKDQRSPCGFGGQESLYSLGSTPCKAEPPQPMAKPSLPLVQTLRNHHPKESQHLVVGEPILFHARGNAAP